MKLFLKKLFCSWSTSATSAPATATTTALNDCSLADSKSSNDSFLSVFGAPFWATFFGSFQKNNFPLILLSKHNHYQRFKTTTLAVLALGLFYVVVHRHGKSGEDGFTISKNKGHDSFQVFCLTHIENNNDYKKI